MVSNAVGLSCRARLLPLFLLLLALAGSGCSSSTEAAPSDSQQEQPQAYTHAGEGIYSFDDEGFEQNLVKFRKENAHLRIIQVTPSWTNSNGGVTKWLVITERQLLKTPAAP